MDPFMAREIVETLSKGIDPLTGRALPQQDVCANEEVQDALLVVLKHCAIESSEQFLVRVRQEKKAAQGRRKKSANLCFCEQVDITSIGLPTH